MTARATLRGLLAGIVGAAGMTLAVAAPAQAAACTQGTGVTVVVNSSVVCVNGNGGTASSLFGAAGHSLTYAKRQPGFVCRVDGSPASDPCVNASPSNAYWALFSSNGSSGSWAYATSGAGNLRVPQGGWVAFVFQTSSSRTYPGVTPIGPAPAPKPTSPKPTTAKPTKGGSGGSTSTRSTPSAGSATPSTKPSSSSKKGSKNNDGAGTSAPPATAQDVAGEHVRTDQIEATSQDTGPTSLLWVGGLIALMLIGGMAAVVQRRRAGH